MYVLFVNGPCVLYESHLASYINIWVTFSQSIQLGTYDI